MQSQNKRKLMLGVLGLLILIRFILIPVFDWQQEQINEINEKEQRLSKTDNIITRLPYVNAASDKLKKSNSKLQERYFNQPSLNTFKLQLQQKIEKLFSEHNLKVTNFNWVIEIPGEITQVRAKISFEGTTKDFAELQLNIAQLPKLLEIAQWTLHVKRMNANSLGKVKGDILITAYNIVSEQETQ